MERIQILSDSYQMSNLKMIDIDDDIIPLTNEQ